MHFQFLGTGNAQQVPRYGCDCPACKRARCITTYRRTPCSAKIDIGDQVILIDAGQVDLTERFPSGKINTILLTHYHMDHVQGLFHLRWGTGNKIPVIGPDDSNGCDDLYKHSGLLDFRPSPKAFEPFSLFDISITPLPLNHSKPTFGYFFNFPDKSLVYLTDTLGLPEDTLQFLQNNTPDIFIIDCTYPPKENPKGHNSLNEALDIIATIKPKTAYLTHISHDLDAYLLENPNRLPDNVFLASDNEKISLIREASTEAVKNYV